MNKGYLSVLLGAVFFACYEVVSKGLLKRGWSEKTGLFTTIITVVAVLALVPVALASGGYQITSGWFVPMLVTGVLNIGIQYALVKAKALEDVSLVAPVASTTPALVIVTSIIMLGEYPTFLGWVGIWLLVLGTYVLNMQGYVQKHIHTAGHANWKVWLAPFLLLGKSPGIRFAFLSAILATFSLNFDALAYRRANVAFSGICIFSIVAAGTLVISLRNGEWKSSPRLPTVNRKQILLAGLFLAGAIWFFNTGFLYTITPYVGTLRRLSIPLTIILAYLFVGERTQFKKRIVGGSLMALGATLIALA